MTNTTTDYAGRTVDMEALQHVAAPADSIRMSLTLRHDGRTRRVSGLQKLVQRYAVVLLTPRGSVRNAPEYGTDLSSAVGRGLVATRAQLAALFAYANSAAQQQIRAAESQTDPPDERLDSAVLQGYDIDHAAQKITLSVRITSLAGDSYVYVIPV